MHRLESALPMILNQTLDQVMPPYRALFKRFDITEQQWRVLRVLWSKDRVNSAELAARALIPAPSLVGVIDRLETKKLVTRVRSTEDRRVVYVSASSTGRKLEKKVTPHVEALHSSIKGAVTASEWNAMVKTLNKIGDAMCEQPVSDCSSQTA